MQQPTTPTHNLTDEEREARRQEQIRRGQRLIEVLMIWRGKTQRISARRRSS